MKTIIMVIIIGLYRNGNVYNKTEKIIADKFIKDGYVI